MRKNENCENGKYAYICTNKINIRKLNSDLKNKGNLCRFVFFFFFFFFKLKSRTIILYYINKTIMFSKKNYN
ncbi:hypothetical protein PFMALIP_04686 [Plasmodium falciparum MaliPS096_E11]|uniref:Uncharacterized protein n=2 Tax=Plasmodium falciparum TaxID=5833 RepID=A0A024WJJ6_PLAFA|nr:hypothetical protein PFMALIP_04686 [Plasmodium falciparum MaliPS096_E11]